MQLTIKNATLANPMFSASMQKISSMIWGYVKDQEIYLLLKAVTEKQEFISKMYKKYAESKDSKGLETLLSETSDLSVPAKIALVLSPDKDFSAMDRFQLREVIEFTQEKVAH